MGLPGCGRIVSLWGLGQRGAPRHLFQPPGRDTTRTFHLGPEAFLYLMWLELLQGVSLSRGSVNIFCARFLFGCASCPLFYAYVIVVRFIFVYVIIVFVYTLYSGFSWVCCCCDFSFLWDFPRPGVCLCLLGFVFGSLLRFSPGRGSACVFLVPVCVLLLQFFPRPGDCLCLFCLWSALHLCNFVFDALFGVLYWCICFSFWFIALAGLGVCLFLPLGVFY